MFSTAARRTVDGGRWAVDGGRWTGGGGQWTVDGGRTAGGGRRAAGGWVWCNSMSCRSSARVARPFPDRALPRPTTGGRTSRHAGLPSLRIPGSAADRPARYGHTRHRAGPDWTGTEPAVHTGMSGTVCHRVTKQGGGGTRPHGNVTSSCRSHMSHRYAAMSHVSLTRRPVSPKRTVSYGQKNSRS